MGVHGAHHFFTDPTLFDELTAVLEGSEAHHAARVLRVRVGEVVTVADGAGRVAEATVASVEPGTVRLRVLRIEFVEGPRPELVLYQAVAKGERMDVVVQKATEVGVRRIVPFVAKRTIVRWDEHKRAGARQRWTAVARAAAKQSRSPWVPEIADVASEAVPDEELVLVLHESAVTRLRDALPAEVPASVGLVVGPEGGFEDAETAALAARGGHVVTLGGRVLRTETAGAVSAAIVAFRYGALG